ncbi:MAG: TetR/AcrR family transcriptional regulator [Sneathiella sp.]|nr:TetR/AcrR family transcriptional regulator [Sneathiella sp.]
MTRSDARQNRQLIMQAFHKATREERAHLPTMSEIVTLSGLGRGTVYRHFPDVGALSFSFMAEGYEALFTESRTALNNAKNKEETFAALKDHMQRYRAFTHQHLYLLTTPECKTSDGYALAHKSQRQCVRRAFRDLANLGKSSPPLLDAAVDLIARAADPEHLHACGVNQNAPDRDAEADIEMALDLTRELLKRFQ